MRYDVCYEYYRRQNISKINELRVLRSDSDGIRERSLSGDSEFANFSKDHMWEDATSLEFSKKTDFCLVMGDVIISNRYYKALWSLIILFEIRFL